MTRHEATVVGKCPAVDLCLLSLPEGVTMPPAMPIGAGANIEEGDFAIALSAIGGNRALGIVKSKRSAGPSEAASEAQVTPQQRAPPCTAEAAMAEAESAAEAEALARGEQPFLVVDAPSADGVVGGPMVSADGSLLGITTLVVSAGAECTRYYAVSSERMARAVDAILEQRSHREQVRGARVVLSNAPANTGSAVRELLTSAGLSEEAAELATTAARKHGRGVLGYFEDAEEAAALVRRIAFAEAVAEEGSQLPSALVVTAEAFDFYKEAEPEALRRFYEENDFGI